MADETKLRLDLYNKDPFNKDGPAQSEPSSPSHAQLQNTESNMRRALGLQDPGTGQTRSRQSGGFSSEPRKRTFSRDGDVPVTIVHSRLKHDGAGPLSRHIVPPETGNRLEEMAQSLTAERGKRELAERLLREAQASVHDLQTKLGHADLALNELRAASRADSGRAAEQEIARQEVEAALVREIEQRETAQRARDVAQAELREERRARREAEAALEEADTARARAERKLREIEAAGRASPRPLTERKAPPPAAKVKSSVKPVARSVPKSGEKEPQPVKWWLTSKKKKP